MVKIENIGQPKSKNTNLNIIYYFKIKGMKHFTRNFLAIAAIFYCSIVWSQDYILVNNNHFSFEGEYYELNYRGIKDYMRMRQISDTDIYNSMAPEFERMKSRWNTAVIGGISAMVQGSAILITGFSLIDDFDSHNKITGTMITGSVILFTGLGLYYTIPMRRHYLSFINQHNQMHRERQIKLVLSPNAHGLSGVGLALMF
jgi:hypothetical protein